MKELICPYCGGSEMVRAQQDSYARLHKSTWSMAWQNLYHDICANCGTVVRSFVENPDKLR
ncbi:hypothetical protein [Streptococcus porci]|uniref:hypothetical protein n=1 Tax=Streptococcus porci TaxID=502567 RepID=UPI0004251E3C|nr:hypothetical protein [Streptococcus porci]